MVRQPAFAGRFYAESPHGCAAELAACLAEPDAAAGQFARLYGGIVPHAGWAYSGGVTAKVMRLLARHSAAQVAVLLGAAHSMRVRRPSLYPGGRWETPLGAVEVDHETVERVRKACPQVVIDADSHASEHSLEVQVPFVQHLFPAARIVPILLPPSPDAVAFGQMLGQVLSGGPEAVIIGTTDLTHYGPRYGMTPHGIGQPGLDWAREVNDRRMIHAIERLDPAAIVPEAVTHQNACGPGAVAATMAACRYLGARSAILIEHITSQDRIDSRLAGCVNDAVGYAGFVFA